MLRPDLNNKQELPCLSPILKDIYQGKNIDRICKENPGMWNIVADEREWQTYPQAFDFLDPQSQFYKLKAFERDIYLELISPYLEELPEGANLLDAGAGIGRFAIKLIEMGHFVHLFDASITSLKKALKHLLDEDATDFELHWGDVADLSVFSENNFDAALAIELVCYCTEPAQALRELVRVTKEGGLIIVSVEGKYGSMLFDENISLDNIRSVYENDLLCLKNHLYVHYYMPDSLERLLREAGIEVLTVLGCHYVPDGILHRLLREDKLESQEYRDKLLEVEKTCREDPVLKNLARAWLAIGRKRLG